VNWDSKDMSCGMEFEFKNHKFKVECSYKIGNEKTPGKADKTLWIDDEEFNGVSGCNKKLKEFFEPGLFIGATGLFQNAKNFTSVKDSERRDNLKKVFDIDYSEECRELEKEEKKLQDEELTVNENRLLVLKSKKFVVEQLLDLPLPDEEYATLKKELDELQSSLFDVKTKLASVNEVNTKKKNLETQLSNFEQKKLAQENKLVLEKENNKKLLSVTIDKSKLEEHTQALSNIKIERIKTFEENNLTSKQQQLANNNATIRTLQKKLQDCKDGKCPICEKPFSTHDTQTINDEIDTLQTSNTELKTSIDNLLAEKKQFEEAVRLNESKKRDKELLETKIKNEEARLTREEEINKSKLEQSNIAIKQLETNIVELNSNISNMQNELSSIVVYDTTELNSSIKNIETKIATNKLSIDNYVSIKNKNDLIQQQNKKTLEDEINTKQEIVDLQSKIDELAIKKQQLTKMRFFLKKEFPSYVISSMIEQIQDDMNDFISKVYYKDLDVEINGDDDKIEVLYGTGDRKIDAINASGAEESLLALSYCYSLNKLKGYNILFSDEVDSPLTEKAALDLAEMMEKIKEEYDFIMIISHVKAVQDYFAINGANVVEVDRNVS
jgi:DNA repair exonuclease SbcCD ATPase subunit